MSKKQKKYSPDFKTKVVLELLSGDKTLSQIASKYSIVGRSILNWKKTFISNASLAFNVDQVSHEYKKKLATKEQEVNELHRQLGKRTAELEWAAKKLQSLDFEDKKNFIKSELKNNISVLRKCEILNFNRSSYYYDANYENSDKMVLLQEIDKIYTEIPFYGYRKVHRQLLENGYKIGINRVNDYMRELGLKVIYPSKKIRTTLANIHHKKYPYLLQKLDINRSNQVWSTDITYIKVPGGFVYLAAVIDWYSKAILSHKISNTMDSSLVIDVLEEALQLHGPPEIFNTDQGSQYTSFEHTKLLLEYNIKISMDGKGRATDNIAIERFWRSAKYENIYINEYNNIKDLKKGVAKYIMFYNNNRFHQALDYQKPMHVYQSSKYKEEDKKAA